MCSPRVYSKEKVSAVSISCLRHMVTAARSRDRRGSFGETSGWARQDHRLPPSTKPASTPSQPPHLSAGHVLLCCWESHPLFQHPTAALSVRVRPASSAHRGSQTISPSGPSAALIVVQGIDASRQLGWVKLCSTGACERREGASEEGDGE